jgi:hypothetical protein
MRVQLYTCFAEDDDDEKLPYSVLHFIKNLKQNHFIMEEMIILLQKKYVQNLKLLPLHHQKFSPNNNIV